MNTLLGRLLAKVDKQPDGCWLWTGQVDRDGYGKMRSGRNGYVHRFMVEAVGGTIPAGMEVDHLCRVRHCVNPDHLEVVTKRENTLRSQAITARNARKTHCDEGHEFTPENTRRTREGYRVCRACNRASVARLRARRKARPR